MIETIIKGNTMNNNIEKLLNIAKNELGYIEKSSNEQLDVKNANSGNNNFTKYARDCFPELQGYAWCCMFVWWCFEKSFGKIQAKNLIGEKTAKCSIMKEHMPNTSNIPHVGDIVFFNDKTGNVGHNGIVCEVNSIGFFTYEGNTSVGDNSVIPNGGMVCKKFYNLQQTLQRNRLDCFGTPRWNLLTNSESNSKHCSINAFNVNIRIGPGTEYEKLGMESRPYDFDLLGIEKDRYGVDWYKFNYKGQIGYIISKYITKSD